MRSYLLTSGFAAAPTICSVLAENGMEEQAVRLLLDPEYPGWLYEVAHGATTIWERWNSLMPDGSPNPAGMNSFNHYAYGSVGQFLFERVAGLQGTKPGFSRIRFSPCIDARIKWCRAAYESASGRWESMWRLRDDGAAVVSLTVPPGGEAEVCLPRCDKDAFHVGPGRYEWTYQF